MKFQHNCFPKENLSVHMQLGNIIAETYSTMQQASPFVCQNSALSSHFLNMAIIFGCNEYLGSVQIRLIWHEVLKGSYNLTFITYLTTFNIISIWICLMLFKYTESWLVLEEYHILVVRITALSISISYSIN
jgi:hypothetical protein